MTDGRKRYPQILATLCIAAVSSSMFVAAPSQAEPDIDTVQTRVDRLYRQAEQASERFNDARLEVRSARTTLARLRSDLDRRKAQVQTVRDQVAASVVSQYQGQALASASQVVLSEDPDAFLDQLTTVAAFDDQQSQLMADFAVKAQRLEVRQDAAQRQVTRIAETTKRLGEEKAEIDDKAAQAKQLLSTLEARAAARASRAADRARELAAQRAAAAAPASPAAPTSPAAPAAPAAPAVGAPASSSAAAAVQYAMAQVGKAYVYGAAGPSAFDCSGLTMMAWQQAGVSLPHSSGAQMGSGTPVSQSQLQPGDLVFYYSPVSHVGMYIGNGKIVNALNPGAGVGISELNSMPYSGAVRPG